MSYAAATRYQQNDVNSMTPARRVVFLYGQILVSLRQAARRLEERDIEQRTRMLTRARDILGELLCTLDFELGGEIAANLASLYVWMMDETLEIDRHQDGKRLERLTQMVAELHGAWEQAAVMVSEVPAQQVAAR
ncbi:MAG TPA: flagellar export chaperone FliS [Gemmatimonadales bacterium]|nr:flagellar export chaperone FliS [Gemmatimonadales bacterium]